MEFNFTSAVAPIHDLMPEAYNLQPDGMEEKTVKVAYHGEVYDLVIRIEYVGIESQITGQLGETHILFASNGAGGVYILTQGPPLEEGLINEVMRTIIIELDNWTIIPEDDNQ